MKYSELPVGYKKERIVSMMRELDQGRALFVSTMYLEEIKILKELYGRELKKDGCLIIRRMEEEALF